jgi:pimeloyl-ACP methyl ester carboxylesterase
MPSIYLPVNDVNVHYSLDDGEGPLVVLLHANPGSSSDFDEIITPIRTISSNSGSAVRTMVLDWPGYGKSSAPKAPEKSTAMMFYSLLEEIAVLLKLPPAIYIGNSVGGYAATRFAMKHPEAVLGLILVSPGGFTTHTYFTSFFCRMQGSIFSLSPRVFASIYIRTASTPTARAMLQRAWSDQATATAKAVNRAIWRSFLDPAHDLRTEAKVLSDSNIPILLIFGRYDIVIPPSSDGLNAQRAFPKAKYVVLQTGHPPFAEQPDQFMEVVKPFLVDLVKK